MVLHDPITPGTDAYLRIYNTDGSESEACGNGTRCVAWAMLSDPVMARPHGAGAAARDEGRAPADDPRVATLVFTVDMGAPRLRLARDPAPRPVPGHALDRTPDRADRRADPRHALRRQHGQPARDLLGRGRGRLRARQDRPAAREPSDLPRARQHLARPGRLAGAHRAARVGARRRPHPRLRFGRLRGPRGGVPQAADGPQGDRHAARRRSPHRMARARRPRAHDGTGRARARGHLRARHSSRERPDGRSTSSPSAAGSTPTSPRPCSGTPRGRRVSATS